MKTIGLQTADGRSIAREVRIADSFTSRSIGLLRQHSLGEQQGLLLIPGGSVHTLGLRFSIDIVFLDRRMQILALAPEVAPWSLNLAPRAVRRVLELARGRIASVGLRIGTYIVVDHDAHADDCAAKAQCRARPTQACARSQLQFSLRRPSPHRELVRSNLACGFGRLKASEARMGSAGRRGRQDT